MNTQQLTLNSPPCGEGTKNDPIRFSLRANLPEARRYISQLHKIAEMAGFKSVSRLFHFRGDECAVEENDPQTALKVRARTLIIDCPRAFSVMPDEFLGFWGVLKNSEKMYLGISLFPSSIETAGGKQLSVEPGPRWECSVKAITENGLCEESRQLALDMLRVATEIGFEVVVSGTCQEEQVMATERDHEARTPNPSMPRHQTPSPWESIRQRLRRITAALHIGGPVHH